MPILSDPEREKIREFESLKKEIRQELDAESKAGRASRILRHPLFLLIAGFSFTGYIGGRLTQSWSDESWKNQQAYLEQQRRLDKRFDLIERTVKAVAQTNTAAEDILARYTWDGWSREEIREMNRRWLETSRDWRVSSKALDQDLGLYFVNPEVRSKFNQIADLRKKVGNGITNLSREPEPSKEVIRKATATILDLDQQIEVLLRSCGELMASETKPESK
jgi:hypothetical protein